MAPLRIYPIGQGPIVHSLDDTIGETEDVWEVHTDTPEFLKYLRTPEEDISLYEKRSVDWANKPI
jgi:hypothetical protein